MTQDSAAPDQHIVLLAGDCPATRAVYHALVKRFGTRVPVHVILESPVSRTLLLKRRRRRLGTRAVIGQLLFRAGIMPLLHAAGRARRLEIARQHQLDHRPIPEPVNRVDSVNSPETQALLRTVDPSVVVISGTRILGAETLAAVPVPFINMHAGITPGYRGVHGGYWALAEQRPEQVGTTIHRVDEGIDTGEVIDQAFFQVSKEDNFSTYPLLHTAAGLPLLLRAVENALAGAVPSRTPAVRGVSRLHHHPTAWAYLLNRVRLGVR
jgi:folate-dependent phosphoribosylglycinamide formyltransferase PurN